MLPTLVHALRAPLSGLVMGMEVAALRLRKHDDDANFLQPMRDTLWEMTHTLDQLTQYVRQAEAKVTQVDPQELMRDVIRSWTKTHPQAQVLWQDTPLAPSGQLFALDLGAVHQSLVHLLDNALEAGKLGAIRVALVRPTPSSVYFVVHDKGPPISADVQARMLEPFFTTKHKHLGLGLACVERCAKAHRGALSIACDASGTKVVLHLGSLDDMLQYKGAQTPERC